jgi:hypothetical protein
MEHDEQNKEMNLSDPVAGGESNQLPFNRRPVAHESAIVVTALIAPIFFQVLIESQLESFKPNAVEALCIAVVYLTIVASAILAIGVMYRKVRTANSALAQSKLKENLSYSGCFLMLGLYMNGFDSIYWGYYGSSQDEIDYVFRWLAFLLQELHG